MPPRGLASLMPWDAWRARKPDDFVATGFFRHVRIGLTHTFSVFPIPNKIELNSMEFVFLLKDQQLVIFKSHGTIPIESSVCGHKTPLGTRKLTMKFFLEPERVVSRVLWFLESLEIMEVQIFWS